MSFKLLAIRPLEACDKRFLKNLQKGQIYKFYSEYTYLDVNGLEIENNFNDVADISFKQSIPRDLYNTNDLSINICALVGKNGSGKSSLLELFYASCYVIASRKQILRDDSYYQELFEKGYFREYALENQFEFLAVVLEHFFESPETFKKQLPELYDSVRKMINFK